MRHEVIHVPNLPAFANLRREWTRLETESRRHSFSVTYEYCALAAADIFAKGGKIYVIRTYDGDGLALLWPVFVQRKGLIRIAYELRCGSGADRGGPLMRHPASAETLRAAVNALKQTKADIFVLDWTDDGSALHAAISGFAQPWIIRRAPRRIRAVRGSDGARRYAIKSDDFATWEDFIATRPRSLRYNHDRRLRQLVTEQKNVEFGWCTTAEDAERVLKWVFANKRDWAEARGITGGNLIAHDIQDFYIEMARRTELNAVPFVTYIKVDGKPVAASLNPVGPNVMESLVTTYDKAFGRYSVGVLLLYYKAKWAHENGRELDMLRHHDNYKTEWANHTPVCRRHAVFLAKDSAAACVTLVGLALHKASDLCRIR